MEVKIMRHDGRAENSDRDVKHVPVAHDVGAGKKTVQDGTPFRVRENNLKKETAADRQDQRNHQRLDVTEAFVLQIEHSQDVQSGDANTDDERNFKKQIQGNGRTDYFGEIAGANRQFAQNPEPQRNWLR